MRSFARVVNCYSRYRAGGGSEDLAAQIVSEAAADMQQFLNRHSWRFFLKEYDQDLWGTESITLSSVSGTLVTITGTTDEDWVNQILTLDGDVYTVVDILDATHFQIAPSYSGATLASGTTATIEQVRIALPDHFGAITGPVLRGQSEQSYPVSVEDVILAYRSSGAQAAASVHAVDGEFLLVLPATANRLYFRYRKGFDNLFQYKDGSATVQDTAQLRTVTGTGTKWLGIPASGAGTVFENKANVMRGFAISNEVLTIVTDTRLGLKTEWKGATGPPSFEYTISTDLNMPSYMDKAVIGLARYAAGKIDQQELQNLILDAIATDSPTDEPLTRGYNRTGPITDVTIGRWRNWR